jgi:hypothetical protein
MGWFGDGREERQAAALEALRLMGNPEVRRRNQEYLRKVKAAKEKGVSMGKAAMIDRLIAETPTYIRELLETEDDRFGEGALASRYAYTFWKEQP